LKQRFKTFLLKAKIIKRFWNSTINWNYIVFNGTILMRHMGWWKVGKWKSEDGEY
jgi:hypothetical protein